MKNKPAIMAVAQRCGALEYASSELKNDKDFVLVAVKQNGLALELASEDLQNDREIVLAAVQKNGYALQYASDELKNDRDFVLAAVQANGWALEYAPDELKNDREIVLAAVQENSWILQYAPYDLKNDKEILLAAMQRCVGALEYASNELRNDKDIVMAVLKQDVHVLEYASYNLRNNREIVLAAVQQHKYAYKFASAELRNEEVYKFFAKKISKLPAECSLDYSDLISYLDIGFNNLNSWKYKSDFNNKIQFACSLDSKQSSFLSQISDAVLVHGVMPYLPVKDITRFPLLSKQFKLHYISDDYSRNAKLKINGEICKTTGFFIEKKGSIKLDDNGKIAKITLKYNHDDEIFSTDFFTKKSVVAPHIILEEDIIQVNDTSQDHVVEITGSLTQEYY